MAKYTYKNQFTVLDRDFAETCVKLLEAVFAKWLTLEENRTNPRVCSH